MSRGICCSFTTARCGERWRSTGSSNAIWRNICALVRVVSFANHDLELVRGAAETRRRYLDFIGTQVDPRYRPALRAYERALRARNALLKSPHPRTRELAAYTEPLLQAGMLVSARCAPRSSGGWRRRRRRAIARSAAGGDARAWTTRPGTRKISPRISSGSQPEDERLRLTTVGPHRDDLRLEVQGMAAAQFASEGQQRTAALALKLAQAQHFRGGSRSASASAPDRRHLRRTGRAPGAMRCWPLCLTNRKNSSPQPASTGAKGDWSGPLRGAVAVLSAAREVALLQLAHCPARAFYFLMRHPSRQTAEFRRPIARRASEHARSEFPAQRAFHFRAR